MATVCPPDLLERVLQGQIPPDSPELQKVHVLGFSVLVFLSHHLSLHVWLGSGERHVKHRPKEFNLSFADLTSGRPLITGQEYLI